MLYQMKCPLCGSFSNKVVDKRSVKGSGETRRRRECLKCCHRFTTYERAVGLELLVIKKDNRLEAYNRDKIKKGIEKALEKRPDFDKTLEITDKVDKRIKGLGKQKIPAKLIGRMVLTELKKLDKVAYLRFASVYRQFKNTDDFVKELTSLGTTV